MSTKYTLDNHDFERMGMLLLHALLATLVTNVLQIILNTNFGTNTTIIWSVAAVLSKGVEQYLTGASSVKSGEQIKLDPPVPPTQ